jgi:hypothetical protein
VTTRIPRHTEVRLGDNDEAREDYEGF